MTGTSGLGYALSPWARAYVDSTKKTRNFKLTCSDEELVTLLEEHGLPVSEAILDVERNIGGWDNLGIYRTLQEGLEEERPGFLSVAAHIRKHSIAFDDDRDDPWDGEPPALWGTGFPRTFCGERPLIVAGGSAYFGVFIDAEGAFYQWCHEMNDLTLAAGSGRTYFEWLALSHRRWESQQWYDAYICADVGDLLSSRFEIPHYEPACDPLFQRCWVSDTVQIRAMPDYPPCVPGTHIFCKHEEVFLEMMRCVHEWLERSLIPLWCGDMIPNRGIYAWERAGFKLDLAFLGTPWVPPDAEPDPKQSGVLYDLSPWALAYIDSTRQWRDYYQTCSDEKLVELLEEHGLPVSEAILDVERNMGGWGKIGIYRSLERGFEKRLGPFSVARDVRGFTRVFEDHREEGGASPLWGTGFPRTFYGDRPLVVAGGTTDRLILIDAEGAFYTYASEKDALFLWAASGRTYLECSGLYHRAPNTWPDAWFDVHLCADVGELLSSHFQIPRYEPACDRLFQHWANDTVQIRLIPDTPPCVPGTCITCKDAKDLALMVRFVQESLGFERVPVWKFANGTISADGLGALRAAGVALEDRREAAGQRSR